MTTPVENQTANALAGRLVDALPELRPTRLVHLKSFPGVWLKCEHENPTGSHKDRAYRAMLKALGMDLRGKTLVDYTTGNGGISLAWLAREVGAHAIAFMPNGMTMERSALIRHYGGEIISTPADGFVAGARAAAEAYVREHPGAILLNQSDNLTNEWGFIGVGIEIIEQLREAQVRPTAFVCAIGTGGSFSGIATALKCELDPGLPAIGIEVPEAPVIWAKRRGETVIPRIPSIIGMGAGKIARNTDERLIDDVEIVKGEEVLQVIETLRAVDGLYVGPSTAANVLVAGRVADRLGGAVITMSFDRADRYNSPASAGSRR